MSSEAKHTPGPWRAMGGDEMVFVARPNIAHVGVTGGNAYKAPFVVVGTPGPKGSEEADARLIAAAPDLLAATKAAFLALCDLADDNISVACFEAIGQLGQAISKAEQAS